MPPARPGQLNLATLLASQHPTIDLHLPAYHASTQNFLQALAEFNSRAVAEINQRREAHATEMNRLAERAQGMEKDTNQCKIKEIELIGGSCRPARSLTLLVLTMSQCSNASVRRPRIQNLLLPHFGAS
jgi:hypothetical protein